jgi:RNA polymerase sigma-70 factor (ECF subfamily)
MTEPVIDTVQLHAWFDRMRAGDASAREELLRAVCNRMERLARKMLKGFPDVHRWADTDDVLQNSLLRLLRALREVRPPSVRAFFGLAAEQMRRELLDLARRFFGPHGLGTNHSSPQPWDLATAAWEPADESNDPVEMDKWQTFHEEVSRLPAEEREVVDLLFYHGWGQAAAAESLGVTVRTV